MRSLRFLVLLFPLAIVGCFDSHGLGGTDAGSIGDAAPFPDAPFGDVGLPDAGPSVCPPDINPWNPMDPHSACSPDGATCTSGSGDACGSFMSCTCESGHWSCAVAEADPVCWCGRQPSVGDRCSTEGMSCGECCPTPGGTGWPAMQCVSGHWAPAACPAIVCPVMVSECPADTAAAIGTACGPDGSTCGDACCSTAIVCRSGRWESGPVADCVWCDEYACGTGHCGGHEICASRCGPADGIEYVCSPQPSACTDCSCIPLTSGQHCEMIDGHPHVSDGGFCG